MTADLSSAHLSSVLTRAGLPPTSPEIAAQLNAACAKSGEDCESILDVSAVRPPDGGPGGDALLVLMREKLAIVTMRKLGIFKRAEPSATVIPLASFRTFAEDDEIAENALVLVGRDPDDLLAFTFLSAAERSRMFRALMAAHDGRYEQWGLQLDPANYGEDFDRYYAQIVAEGPASRDGWHDWFSQEFGDFDSTSALGFAMEWRRCEIADVNGREPSSRVMRIGNPMPWIDAAPGVRQVLVRLGGQLFDEGMLAPPYDERTFDTGEPITHSDAGPARLIALIRIAATAQAIEHPRAPEWIEAARAGMPAMPESALFPGIRALWSQIQPART